MNRQTNLMIKQRMTLIIGLILLVAGGLTGCPQQSGQSPPEKPATTPSGPDIQAVPDKETTIQAHAVGAEKYEWKLEGPGKLSATTGPVVDYSRPDRESGRATLTVTAYNTHGASQPTQLSIRIAETVAARLDALAIPAGWMSGGGDPMPFITLSPGQTGCQSRPGCTRVTYKPGGQWGGIYWWPQVCGDSGTDAAWQKVKADSCGIDVRQAGNFKEINRLIFWVRGERGGEGIEFKIGAIDIEPKPGRSLGKVTLKTTWEPKEIDLKGMDLTKAIGLFAWIATDVANPQGAVFYLDGIQFEGVR